MGFAGPAHHGASRGSCKTVGIPILDTHLEKEEVKCGDVLAHPSTLLSPHFLSIPLSSLESNEKEEEMCWRWHLASHLIHWWVVGLWERGSWRATVPHGGSTHFQDHGLPCSCLPVDPCNLLQVAQCRLVLVVHQEPPCRFREPPVEEINARLDTRESLWPKEEK